MGVWNGTVYTDTMENVYREAAPPKPNTNPFGRRLPAVEPVPSPYPVPVVMIILAFMTLVYYVIRRMRSRAPKKALSDRVISSACPCRRQPAKHRAITPLRHVVVVRIT